MLNPVGLFSPPSYPSQRHGEVYLLFPDNAGFFRPDLFRIKYICMQTHHRR